MGKLYIVERRGKVCSDIYGVFDSFKEAENATIIARLKETDDYHSFYILERNLNECGFSEFGGKEYYEGKFGG